MSVRGKIAIVTGAGTGIGKGIAVELARQGAKVAVHYNSSDAGARDTKAQIDALGGDAIIVKADVASKAEINRMVDEAASHYGGIDILINNAALQLNTPFFDYDEASFDRMMNINLKGYWQCIQAVVPHMKRRDAGRIILIASVHSKRPTDFDAVYSMTKGGIRMLGRESAIELAKYNITVNTIEPGAVDVGKYPKPTREPTEEEKQAHAARQLKRFPLGRVGQPYDVGKLACFLASEDTPFLSGSAIRLDGASMLL